MAAAVTLLRQSAASCRTEPNGTNTFLDSPLKLATSCAAHLATGDGSWIVKGFIHALRNVYAMPGNTKVVSKIAELMLLPSFAEFARENELKMVLPREQNHYPDLTFVANDDSRYAVDLKTTCRIDRNTLNTMTLCWPLRIARTCNHAPFHVCRFQGLQG